MNLFGRKGSVSADAGEGTGSEGKRSDE